MLNRVEQATQRWSGKHSEVDTWLSERQALLVQYCQLLGLPPFEREQCLPDKQEVQGFCQRLMDYASAGHFEVYDKILAESVDKAHDRALAERLYPEITRTTDAALSFNDKYGDWQGEENWEQLDRHLAELGQSLEWRFELEDQLLKSLDHQ